MRIAEVHNYVMMFILNKGNYMSTLQEIKVQAAVETLITHGLNQSKAAKALGISRGGLRALLASATGSTSGINKDILSSYTLVK